MGLLDGTAVFKESVVAGLTSGPPNKKRVAKAPKPADHLLFPRSCCHDRRHRMQEQGSGSSRAGDGFGGGLGARATIALEITSMVIGKNAGTGREAKARERGTVLASRDENGPILRGSIPPEKQRYRARGTIIIRLHYITLKDSVSISPSYSVRPTPLTSKAV